MEQKALAMVYDTRGEFSNPTPGEKIAMIVGTTLDSHPGEKRVALIPAAVPALTKLGLQVAIERGAGQLAGFPDSAYEEQGASVVADKADLYSKAGILLRLRGLAADSQDLQLLHSHQVVIGLMDPFGSGQTLKKLAEKDVSAFALELLPRISRAQSMDALSSMATISGYKAVLLAADALPKMFPLLMTAAGTISPARAFVIGAGVAGLQAIATARRLGAVVHSYDVRPAVKEQVESL
ncbi:MAG TPA: hypothetical protein VFG11_08390, partial [Acidobacteriota bacterium]|nr:hypothetical protein [Acidobacteriota bacterium]